MRIFFFGTGNMARLTLEQVGAIPENIEILGFIDNNPEKWGEFLGKKVFSPAKLRETDFDVVVVMSDIYFQSIKDDLIYWYEIDREKIKGRVHLLKILMKEKYKDTTDKEIQEILSYWEKNDISVFNQYVKKGKERYIVHWDSIENMPYIIVEDKRMYYPYDYMFQVYDGKRVVANLYSDQQSTSPHLYIQDDIKVEHGDIIADAGVQEGNFSLRYIEEVSRAYLFESNKRWIRPLQKTFEKFKEKVSIYNVFLGKTVGDMKINLDSVLKGKRLDFLKMDVEGAEIEALLGGRETLLNNKVKCSICSYHKNGDERAIKDILNQYGYKTNTSKGYMVFWHDKDIYSTQDFRRGIVYGRR